MKPEYIYRATVDRVIDGDTIDFIVDVGFNVRTRVRTRLYGVNTPEVSTPEGRGVRDMVQTIWPHGQPAIIKTFKDPKDKYGRWLAEVWTVNTGDSASINFNQWLIDQGHAAPFMEK